MPRASTPRAPADLPARPLQMFDTDDLLAYYVPNLLDYVESCDTEQVWADYKAYVKDVELVFDHELAKAGIDVTEEELLWIAQFEVRHAEDGETHKRLLDAAEHHAKCAHVYDTFHEVGLEPFHSPAAAKVTAVVNDDDVPKGLRTPDELNVWKLATSRIETMVGQNRIKEKLRKFLCEVITGRRRGSEQRLRHIAITGPSGCGKTRLAFLLRDLLLELRLINSKFQVVGCDDLKGSSCTTLGNF